LARSFLGRVAGVEHDQLELGAAERLDAALRVDVFHPHLGAVAHHGSRARIEARDRHQQSDLHFGRLLSPHPRRDQAGGCAGEQAAPRQCGPDIFRHDYSSLKFFETMVGQDFFGQNGDDCARSEG
jgi:hypothetical protein